MLDERARHDLHRAIEDLLGPHWADTIIALLPPADRAGAATTDDLAALEARLDVGLDSRFARHDARADVRLEAIEARFARVDARMAQVERQTERWRHDHARALMLGLVGSAATTAALCLGTVTLAA